MDPTRTDYINFIQSFKIIDHPLRIHQPNEDIMNAIKYYVVNYDTFLHAILEQPIINIDILSSALAVHNYRRHKLNSICRFLTNNEECLKLVFNKMYKSDSSALYDEFRNNVIRINTTIISEKNYEEEEDSNDDPDYILNRMMMRGF